MSPTRRDTLLAMADILSARGTCMRARVGCIIAIDGRAVSWGYNGAPPGLPHCDENDHGWYGELVDKSVYPEIPFKVPRSEVEGCKNTTHAEANAIAFAAKQGISTAGATLYTTVAPCFACSNLIIAAGIVAVEYDLEYRDRSGIERLKAAGINVHSSN